MLALQAGTGRSTVLGCPGMETPSMELLTARAFALSETDAPAPKRAFWAEFVAHIGKTQRLDDVLRFAQHPIAFPDEYELGASPPISAQTSSYQASLGA